MSNLKPLFPSVRQLYKVGDRVNVYNWEGKLMAANGEVVRIVKEWRRGVQPSYKIDAKRRSWDEFPQNQLKPYQGQEVRQ